MDENQACFFGWGAKAKAAKVGLESSEQIDANTAGKACRIPVHERLVRALQAESKEVWS